MKEVGNKYPGYIDDCWNELQDLRLLGETYYLKDSSNSRYRTWDHMIEPVYSPLVPQKWLDWLKIKSKPRSECTAEKFNDIMMSFALLYPENYVQNRQSWFVRSNYR